MAAVTEILTNANLVDSGLFSFEFVNFKTSASGDTYTCKTLREIDGAFASQTTTDGEELQVSWSGTTITITTESTAVVTGSLVIIGRK